jgi:hypothetical protein
MEPRILFAEVRHVKQYSGLIFATGRFIPSFVSNKPNRALKYLWVWLFGWLARSKDHPARGASDNALSCLF